MAEALNKWMIPDQETEPGIILFRNVFEADADAVVDISPEIDRKANLLLLHDSQFMEWLPWIDLGLKDFDKTKLSGSQRREFLKENYYLGRNRQIAERYREMAQRYYHHNVEYAEAFQISEYGAPISPEDFQNLMTGRR